MLSTLLLLAVQVTPTQPCAACHINQAVQHRASMHAESLKDPLYLAMRAWARDEAGQAAASACMTCHAVGTFEGRTPGVDCEACHQSRTVAGPKGLTVDTALPVRARRKADAPHATVADAQLVSGAFCLVCHAELRNQAGLPVCTTGPEAAENPQGPGCLSCHRAHDFPGAVPALLARAATLAIEPRGGEVVVTVGNVGAGHALPTGSALRQIRLDVVFTDRAGRRVGDNAADTAALFARLLQDKDGKSPAPPWRAIGVARDTRLARGELRRLTYPIPEGAAAVAASLTYRRAPAAIAERLNLEAHALLQPIVMARFSRGLP